MNGGDDGKDSAWDEDDDDEDDDDDEPRSTSAAPVRNDMAFLHHPTHPEGAHPGQPGYDQVMMPAHATMREMALHQHKVRSTPHPKPGGCARWTLNPECAALASALKRLPKESRAPRPRLV